MRVDFITLFPEAITPFLESSILGRAQRSDLVQFSTTNPRDFCEDRHRKVDDRPFGGHAGMLIKAEPIARAIESIPKLERRAIVLPSPAAPLFTQNSAAELATYDQLILVCGHYEGIDQRIESSFVTHVYSLGDFVVTNGELPSLLIADSVIRLQPGVLGDEKSLESDSFSDGLLSAPNYTRPEVWRGHAVPEVLLSGNHRLIENWRRTYSLRLTQHLRPDLLAKAELTKADVRLLQESGNSREPASVPEQ